MLEALKISRNNLITESYISTVIWIKEYNDVKVLTIGTLPTYVYVYKNLFTWEIYLIFECLNILFFLM